MTLYSMKNKAIYVILLIAGIFAFGPSHAACAIATTYGGEWLYESVKPSDPGAAYLIPKDKKDPGSFKLNEIGDHRTIVCFDKGKLGRDIDSGKVLPGTEPTYALTFSYVGNPDLKCQFTVTLAPGGLVDNLQIQKIPDNSQEHFYCTGSKGSSKDAHLHVQFGDKEPCCRGIRPFP